jgi:hypothetical protein
MDKTLTIRLDRAQDAALTACARAQGKTRSAIVRELLDRGLEEHPLGRRIGHLKGRLEMASPSTGWQRHVRDRNWRLKTPRRSARAGVAALDTIADLFGSVDELPADLSRRRKHYLKQTR